MIDKILKYFNNKKLIIITLSIVVIIGALTTELTSEVVLISLGGLIGYLTPQNKQ
jgi:hypothetical protein